MSYLVKNANFLVFHTKESYSRLNISFSDPRIIYFFHPFFNSELLKVSDSYVFDVLIWGNVRSSKGVLEFVQYLKKTNQINKFKIKIVGKFESRDLFEKLSNLTNSSGVSIEDKYIEVDELKILHQKSRVVFFPYIGSSVLNSGALVMSLTMGRPIIGPGVGAFKELGEKGFVNNYENFDQVTNLLSLNPSQLKYPENSINEFIKNHNFDNFVSVLDNALV